VVQAAAKPEKEEDRSKGPTRKVNTHEPGVDE